MTPLDRHHSDIQRGCIIADDVQSMVVGELNTLYFALLPLMKKTKKSPIKKIITKISKKPTLVKGLYLWGGVGRGKTYMMDIFYESLPFKRKMRIHFHRFMLLIHQELSQIIDEPNPLTLIAKKIAQRTKIICFDEFFVTDITDAMLLGELFKELFVLGVTLVATSNVEPDELYKEGLQRERFLPAIDLIHCNTRVIHVNGATDYRLRILEKAPVYYSPCDEQTENQLYDCFRQLALELGEKEQDIIVNGRLIPAKYTTDDIIWFEFNALCDGPRSQQDYIELARVYHTVLISRVPQFGEERDDVVRRFIYLVDELYDRQVKIILSAEVRLQDLYIGTHLAAEFQRTQSRLQEMQSHEYLEREHRP